MGHIHLAAPVAHIWYLRGIPSRMALLLDVTPKQLEEVVYFVSYIVTDPKESGLAYKQILSEREFRETKLSMVQQDLLLKQVLKLYFVYYKM